MTTPTTQAQTTDEGLLRVIGPVGLAASVVNVVIGAGVFALPAVLAGVMGATAPLAFVVAGAVVGLVTICMARAGARVPRSGGPSAAAAAAYGPFAGFLTGVVFWLSNVLATAGVSAALADAAGALIPTLAQPAVRLVFLVLLYTLLAWVNIRGARPGTGFAIAAASIKFGALLVFVLMGTLLINGDHLAWPGWPSGGSVGRGAIVAIFALAGMEIALGASGEVRDPERTIPRALIGAMATIAVLYVVVQVVAQGVLGPALAQSRVPLADALAQGGRFGGTFILIASVVSMTGRVEGDLLGSPRQIFAFARAGFLPRTFAAIHSRTHVPHWAIVAHAVVALALALSGSFAALAITSSVALIVLYIIACASAWALDRRAGVATLATTVVPALGILSLLWMLTSATLKEIVAVVGVLALAGAVYALRIPGAKVN